MNNEDAYWAGFIDGEGSIGINKIQTKKRGKLRAFFVVTLQVSNTKKWILEEFQRWAGIGGVYFSHHKNPRYKPCWNYRVEGFKIKSILKRLLPYLRLKRKQAEIVLEFIRIRESQMKIPIAKIKELKEAGLSYCEIARRLNCDHTTISRLDKENRDGMKRGTPYASELFRLWEEITNLNKRGVLIPP